MMTLGDWIVVVWGGIFAVLPFALLMFIAWSKRPVLPDPQLRCSAVNVVMGSLGPDDEPCGWKAVHDCPSRLCIVHCGWRCRGTHG